MYFFFILLLGIIVINPGHHCTAERGSGVKRGDGESSVESISLNKYSGPRD